MQKITPFLWFGGLAGGHAYNRGEAMTEPGRARNVPRSIAAVVAGMIAGIVLSVGTDLALQAARIFPSLSEPNKFTTPLLLLATSYRSVYGVLGSYIAARLAPSRPMAHALVLGVLGFAATIIGAVANWNYGPNWYPLALVVLAIPCAWAGGELRVVQLRTRADGVSYNETAG